MWLMSHDQTEQSLTEADAESIDNIEVVRVLIRFVCFFNYLGKFLCFVVDTRSSR